MSTNKQQSFEYNFNKLEKLSTELQQNKVSIDALVPRMKEALGAIKVCKDVLATTRAQLQEIGDEFSAVHEESNS